MDSFDKIDNYELQKLCRVFGVKIQKWMQRNDMIKAVKSKMSFKHKKHLDRLVDFESFLYEEMCESKRRAILEILEVGQYVEVEYSSGKHQEHIVTNITPFVIYIKQRCGENIQTFHFDKERACFCAKQNGKWLDGVLKNKIL
jgi:hypothetical protein